MRRNLKDFALFLLFLGLFSVGAEDAPSSPSSPWTFGLADAKVFRADFRAEYALTRPSGESGTAIYAQAGGGIQERPDPREGETGNSLFTKANGYEGEYYWAPNFQWDLLLTQTLLRLGPGASVKAFSGYRGRLDFALERGSTAVYGDRNGLFGNSVLAGVGIEAVKTDARTLKSGVKAEISLEYGPRALSGGGISDFRRVDAKVAGYLPVLSLASGSGREMVSAYLSGRLMADWCGGDDVPLYVSQGFGGRVPVDSLGGEAVRGYGKGQFDTARKGAATVELRVLGPSFPGVDDVLPAAFFFADSCLYSDYLESADMRDKGGYAASVGAGLALQVFGFAQPSLALAFPLTREDDRPFAPNLDIRFKFLF